MQLTLIYDHAENDTGPGPLVVGWLRDIEKGGVIYPAPERVTEIAGDRRQGEPPPHGKSLARCPAVTRAEARVWTIRCPVDLNLGFVRDEAGRAGLVNRAGSGASMRAGRLRDLVVLAAEAEWRNPLRPVVQLKLPYVFICDEPCWLVQTSPHLHWRPDPLPGLTVTGRFPIDLWPRQLMWGFEWHDPGRDLVVRRGEPLFHLSFEGSRPERSVKLVEAEMTDDLRAYLDHVSGAVNYVSQTFQLFRAAEEVRPVRLLTPRRR